MSNTILVIKEIILSLIAWIFALPFIVLILPILILLAIYKLILNQIVRQFHPEWTPLTGLDISFATQMDSYKSERKLLGTIGVLLIVDGDVDVQVVREEFAAILEMKNITGTYKYDRLRKLPRKFYGHWYWGDEIQGIDLNDTIYERKVQKTDLREFLRVWLNQDFGMDGRPLWEIVLYKDENEYKGKSLLALKMAHVIGDGETVRIYTSIFLRSELDNTAFELKRNQWIMTTKEKVILWLMGPRLMVQYLSNFVFHSDYLTRVPKMAECTLGMATIELETIKKIRRAHGCKFTDVMLVLVANTMRRFMLDSIPESQLPHSLRIISSFTDPAHRDTTCNEMTALVFRVPMRNPDQEACFHTTMLESRRLFGSNVHKMLYSTSNILYLIPDFLIHQSKDSQVGVCCGMTSVPKVIDDTTVFGKYPLVHIFPLLGMQMKQFGFGITSVTRGDKLDIGFMGNKALFPTTSDLDRVVNYFVDEVSASLELADIRSRKIDCKSDAIIIT